MVENQPQYTTTNTQNSASCDSSSSSSFFCAVDGDYKQTPESLGTTIMALEFPGGVVIGADTRTTTLPFVSNRAARKISQLHDRIFVARSGDASATQALAAIIKRYMGDNALEIGDLPLVNSAASLAQLLSYYNKNKIAVSMIIAGWDKSKGGQVYQVTDGGSKIRTKYAVAGSGSTYVSGFVESNFREGMTREESIDFVTKTIALAINCHGTSGGMVRLMIVSEAAVEEACIGNDVIVNSRDTWFAPPEYSSRV